MKNNQKFILLFIALSFFLVLAFLGRSFAWFDYLQEIPISLGSVDGNVNVTGTQKITLSNLVSEKAYKARRKTDNYIDFTVNASNMYHDTTMYYYVKLNYGDNVSGKERIEDDKLVFDISKQVNGEPVYIIDSERIPVANGVILFKETLNSQQTKNTTYRLRIWVKDGQAGLSDYFASFDIDVKQTFYDPAVNSFISTFEDDLNPIEQMIVSAKEPTGIDFSKPSSYNNEGNGRGIYRYDDNIVYFRGAVDNNNIIFANFCWKIVRTTETGGIKIIYNGTPTNNQCTNTTESSTIIGTIEFNVNYDSPAYSGYMYGTVYPSKNDEAVSGAYYGKSFTFDDTTGLYTLVDAEVTSPDATHHYSCNSTSPTGTCETIRYYYYERYYIELSNGKSVSDALSEMFSNNTDSTIKTYIENWYVTNIANNSENLNGIEDTVYCNDRSASNLGGWDPNGGPVQNSTLSYYYFGPKERVNNPSLSCNKNDSFTVNETDNGNGKLEYSVGMLSEDEIRLAGGAAEINESYYLYNSLSHWTFSPYAFGNDSLSVYHVDRGRSVGNITYNSSKRFGVRPVISLKPNIIIEDGDGSSTNPYIARAFPAIG